MANDFNRTGNTSRQNYAPQIPTGKIDGTTNYDPVEAGRELIEKYADRRALSDFTTSQLRKILASAAVVKNRIDRETAGSKILSAALQNDIQYLRLKLVYQMGREQSVKRCLSEFNLDLPAIIKNIGNSKENFDRFYRLLESIVAYRKFIGEK